MGGYLNYYHDSYLESLYESLGFKVVKRSKYDKKLADPQAPERDVIYAEYKGETNDPQIIAGMFEAAWNRRLDSAEVPGAVLNEINDKFSEQQGGEVGAREQALPEGRTKNFLERAWPSYRVAEEDTAPGSPINPTKNILVKDKPGSNKDMSSCTDICT